MIRTKFNPSQPYRYVRYARMSTDMQNPRSPDQQFDTIDAMLRQAGCAWQHVTDYRDDGKSGRRISTRPQFVAMLNAIRSGTLDVDLILVDTLERFGRMQNLDQMRRDLEQQDGVLILTADSQFADPTGDTGRMLGVIESLRSTSEARTKAHNVLRGKKDAVRQKRWPGGPPPLGYQLKSIMKPGSQPAEVAYRVLEPDPRTAPLVQRIFALAREKGWGGGRIAKHLNSHPELLGGYQKLSASTVDYTLDNPIYIGTRRFNRVSTDVIADRRVSRRNEGAEVLYVEDFCEPLVERTVFDAVHQQRRERAARLRAVRKKWKTGGKQLRATVPGVTLKYPLTGFVRCGECGTSMRPNKSGDPQYDYFYYYCPCSYDGRCSNRRRVRGDWLWGIFVARLRTWLLPLPDAGESDLPAWLPQLLADIRGELLHDAEQRQAQRPLLEREYSELNDRIHGWNESLGNPELAQAVRQHLERQFQDAMERQREIEAELAALNHEVTCVEQQLDANMVIKQLQRLADVLAGVNPTEINMELTRHVEAIRVHANGTVVMRTHRLGVFEGLAERLAEPIAPSSGGTPSEDASEGLSSAGGDGNDDAHAHNGNGVVHPRSTLPPRRATSWNFAAPPALFSQVLSVGQVRLPERWVDDYVVRMPEKHTWSVLNAAKVAELRAQGWTQQRLADHFGKSIPTIRKALRLAAEQDGGVG